MSRNGRRKPAQPAGFRVSCESSGDEMRLVLRGDLDLASVGEFERAVSSAEGKRPAAMTIDLSGLDFLDSRGLRAILAAQRACEEGDCKLTLIAGEQARRLFDLTGLSAHLPLMGLDAEPDPTSS